MAPGHRFLQDNRGQVGAGTRPLAGASTERRQPSPRSPMPQPDVPRAASHEVPPGARPSLPRKMTEEFQTRHTDGRRVASGPGSCPTPLSTSRPRRDRGLTAPSTRRNLKVLRPPRRSPAGPQVASLRGRWPKVVTWLILPVVICLSQRLSHACLSISKIYSETANGSLNQLSFI